MPAARPELRIGLPAADVAEVRVCIRFGAGLTEVQVKCLSALVEALVTLGYSGGFPVTRVAPDNSTLKLLETAAPSANELAFRVRAQNADFRAMQLLCNMAWKWAAGEVAVESIDVVCDNGSAPRKAPVPDWSNDALVYPGLSGEIQVAVERTDPGDMHRQRRCIIDFGRPVPTATLDAAILTLRPWRTVLEAGAFALPVRPAPEAEVWCNDIEIYDEGSVEVAFTLFEASEAAWIPLINVLDAFSRRVTPIAAVSVE